MGLWYAGWERNAKNGNPAGTRDSTLRVECRDLGGALGVHEEVRAGCSGMRRVPLGID